MAEQTPENVTHLLDTSALLAWYFGEDGQQQVNRLIADGAATVSVLTLVEARTRLLQINDDKAAADHVTTLWTELFPEALSFDGSLVRDAADLKAAHAISFADACIAATAIGHRLIFLHKDPEFDAIDEARLRVLRLPCKPTRR